MQLEEGYKTDRGNGSGTSVGYSIEARSLSKPTYILGNMIGEKWTRLEFPRGEKGVPIPGCWDGSGQMNKLGLFSYQSAQAIRWWFIAAAEDEHVTAATPIRIPMPCPWSIETRLVRHEIKYQYTVTAVSACDFVDNHSAPPKEPEPSKAKISLTDEEADLLTYLSTPSAHFPDAPKLVEITPMMRTVIRDLLDTADTADTADTEHAKRQDPEQPAESPAAE
jgi:hypothetical protein